MSVGARSADTMDTSTNKPSVIGTVNGSSTSKTKQYRKSSVEKKYRKGSFERGKNGKKD